MRSKDVVFEAGSLVRRRHDARPEKYAGDPLTDNARLSVSSSDDSLGDRIEVVKETFVVEKVVSCTRVDESLLIVFLRGLVDLALEFHLSHVSAAESISLQWRRKITRHRKDVEGGYDRSCHMRNVVVAVAVDIFVVVMIFVICTATSTTSTMTASAFTIVVLMDLTFTFI